jgi:uncharacterized protein YndB with AHSA1/START domain
MESSERLVLDTTRRMTAPRPEVFAACSEPERWGAWWGPRGFESSVEADVRVGGGYRISMQPPEGDAFHLVGEFLEIEPPHRLAYTFVWEPPDPDDRETVVTLTFEEDGEATVLTLRQEGFATRERLRLHEDGWSDSLDRLDELLASTGDG